MDKLDETLFPRAAKFVKQLPKGLASHPECKVVSEAYETIASEYPKLVETPGMPPVIAAYLSGQYSDTWMPVCVAQSLLLMIFDRCFISEDEYIAASRRNTLRLFRRPAYRALMFVMSPSLVAMGAKSRFNKLYRGIELSASSVKKQGARFSIDLVLAYPPGIYSDGLLRRRTGEAMMVAIEAAGAKETEMKVEAPDDQHANFSVSWEY